MQKVIFMFCVLVSCSLFAQSDNGLKNSFAKENAKSLSNFFKPSIDLKLPDIKGIYNKQQAKLVLNKFFDENPIESFTIKHEGGGGEKALFQIGSLQCGESNFRTYILYDIVEGKPQIIELRIESEE